MTLQPHAVVFEWWKSYLCDSSQLVPLTMNGRYPVRVQPPLVNAAVALSEAIMTSGYRTPMDATGSYFCRKIAGSDAWSLHALGVAIDWSYPTNRYLRGATGIVEGFVTDTRFELTEANVDAVEAIMNEDGEQIWRWLGWSSPRGIADTMHMQVNVAPERCEPVSSHYIIGEPEPGWEPELWRLFELAGGEIDANKNSAQINALFPWHDGVPVNTPMLGDFQLLSSIIGLSDANLQKLVESGIYRFGKELASLRERAYRP